MPNKRRQYPESIFFHAFFDPGVHLHDWCLNRLPRKMNDRLEKVGDSGWGIYIVEGPDWYTIAVILAIFFALPIDWCTLVCFEVGRPGRFRNCFVFSNLGDSWDDCRVFEEYTTKCQNQQSKTLVRPEAYHTTNICNHENQASPKPEDPG
jgi:hypothetical protein